MLNLDPQTSAKLAQFGRRQKRLLFLRAACVALVAFVATMSLVALVDWIWILSESTRWLLSMSAYAVVIGLVWWTSLSRWFRPQDPSSLARSFELANPEMREDLLSAVELSDDTTANGSPAFRKLLQDKVAANIQWVEIGKLLPLRLIGRWLVAAIAVACFFGTMLTLPGFSYRQLFTRAALPGANLDRVSLTQVVVLQPTPASQLVPRGETIGVVVEIQGPKAKEVTLESYSSKSGMERQRMRAQGQQRFAANITVRDETVDYRILAGDAVTRLYRLESRSRPRVKAFEKTYKYPSYAGVPDETITETNGDLIAIEGTVATVALQVDQPVSEASFMFEPLSSDQVITTEAFRGESGFLTASLPISESGIYKVHLKSADTGFENTFSPKHEIRAEPDLVPRVDFAELPKLTIHRPANDIVPLAALAEDNLPLAAVEHLVSINGGDWKRTDLEFEAQRRVSLQWELDLLPLKVTSGDIVTTKLVALDRKGQHAESSTLQIVITSDEFDPDRHRALELKAIVADRLEEMTINLQAASATAVQIFEGNSTTKTLDAIDRTSLLDAASKLEQESAKTFEVVLETLAEIPAGVDAYELELVAHMMARFGRHSVAEMRAAVNSLTTEDPSEIKDGVYKTYQRHFRLMGTDPAWVNERFRDFLTHDLFAGIGVDLNGLYQQQKAVIETGDRFSPNRLRRHQRVAISYIHALEDLMQDHQARVRRNSRSQFTQVSEMITSVREEMQLALDNADEHSPLQRVTERLHRELRSRQNNAFADGALPHDIRESRKELARRSGVLADPMDLAVRSAERTLSAKKYSQNARDAQRIAEAEARCTKALGEFSWRTPAIRTELSDRQAAHEARPDRNGKLMADIALAGRAMDHVFPELTLQQSLDDSEATLVKMRTLRDAYRKLEAGHELLNIGPNASRLLALERWESQKFSARTESPRIWDRIQLSIELGHDQGRAAGYPNDLMEQVNGMRWSREAHRGGEKINRRRWTPNTVSAAAAVEELVNRHRGIAPEVRQVMAEARQQIKDLIPSIQDTAKELAAKTRKLEEKTEQLAEEVKQEAAQDQGKENQAAEQQQAASDAADTPDAQETTEDSSASELTAEEKLAALAAEQEALNTEVQDLLEALAKDASSQDLMDEEGRERARDADDSIGMIEQPAEKAQEELDAAQQATDALDQAAGLEDAAAQQDKMADALEQVADHFEKLDAGEDVSESREAMRQAEAELPNGREIAKQYEKAEELANLAQQAKDEQEALMRQLERELQESPEMQEALSDIAAEATAQALRALEFSEEREEQSLASLENSDRAFKAQKEEIVNEMRSIAAQAQTAANHLAAQAESAAHRGDDKESAQEIGEAKRKLEQAIRQANDANPDRMLSELQETAAQVSQDLQEAQQQLSDAAKKSQESSREKMTNEREKPTLKRDMENAARRQRDALVRDAQARERNLENQRRNAENQKKQAEREVANDENRVRQAEANLKRDSDNEGLKQNLDRARQKLENQKRNLDAKTQQLADATRRKDDAKSQREEESKRKTDPLNAENPAAEFAARSAEEAAKRAEQLADKAKKLGEDNSAANSLAAEEGQLEAVRQTQESIKSDVEVAADDLSRASRHEQRLGGSPLAAEMLADASEEVREVAEDSVAKAEQKSEDAREASKVGEDKPQGTEASPSAQAAEAVAAAGESIGEEADKIAKMFAQSQAAAEAQAASEASASSPTGQQPGESQPGQPSPDAQAAAASEASASPEASAAAASPPGQPQSQASASGQQPPAQSSGESAAASAAQQASGQSPIAPQSRESAQQRGERLAQMLDELDRQMHASAAQPSGPPTDSAQPAQGNLPSIEQMAAQQAQAMSKSRSKNLQEAKEPGAPAEALVSGEGADLSGMDENALAGDPLSRDGSEWGMLRKKQAQDATSGRRSEFASQYKDHIKAYFKVIAERSRK